MEREKKPEKKCDCVFCNSQCPNCGSTNIKVRFSAEFCYGNELEDKIYLFINNEIDDIELTCNGCDESWWFVLDKNGKLGVLANALRDLLDNISFTIDDDGVIKSHIERIVHRD